MKNNSIRLRLTQGELRLFAETGRVEEAIEFGRSPRERFVYALEKKADAETMSAVFADDRITVYVPKNQADEWTATARVGMECEQQIGDGKTLRLLVEKDFACLEPRAGGDDADAFPHPLEGVTC